LLLTTTFAFGAPKEASAARADVAVAPPPMTAAREHEVTPTSENAATIP
jgi:hypothetical protein